MEKPELIKDGKRLDGRTPKDLRPVKIEAGVLKEAQGSALVEWGGNKVLAGVYGPRECIPKHGADPYKAKLKIRYTMAPFCSKGEHSRSGPNRRSIEISKVIREAFEPVVLSSQFPRSQIEVYIEVVQAEGGTRVASLTAAAVALADAGIPMSDMVSAIAVGKINGQLVVDLGKDEDNYGESDVPMAVTHRDKQIVLMQMDGLLTREELAQNIDEAIEASEKVYELQADALKKSYEKEERGKLKL
ncbi:exosome complex exonuclease Rrp41 [Candidatus Micrarchaeota archaeon]|nr:exosome complex exonuclease Rrp41 [Candidatus Micrarchaeota archaeon]MBD3418386.1 exosome complex exonuclease Rrp41 [Candidatus Micrarchaeota archaeon]